MNKLNYTEEIFNILSRGGFISNNSVQARIKRFFILQYTRVTA